MNQPVNFNFPLKFGPYSMRIIEQPVMAKDATLSFNSGQQAWFILAGLPRQDQFQYAWTAASKMLLDELETALQDGSIPPDQAPSFIASAITDLITRNPYLRSLNIFERIVAETPVQLDAPTSKLITPN